VKSLNSNSSLTEHLAQARSRLKPAPNKDGKGVSRVL
jgi:hypothetical protein